jgi:lysozyme
MRMTKAGLDIIKEFEGFRSKAYLCPAGVWTIGYGHTSAAGAPEVREGMTISRAEGERILKADLKTFEAFVREAIRVELTPAQYSACVSLCYNIGGGAFKRSSVARFCNKREWRNAADAFALWNKAGGKVLPGLTRRRAAEAALFMSDDVLEDDEIRPVVDEPKGKPMVISSTNIAAGATAAAGVTAATKEVVDNTSSLFSGGNIVTILLILVILGGAAWIIRERWMKARDWDV